MIRYTSLAALLLCLCAAIVGNKVSAQPASVKKIEELNALCRNDAGGSCIKIGLKLYRNDRSALVEVLASSCLDNNAFACANYGVMIGNGVGIAKSLQSANQKYEKACALEYMPGCYLRGLSFGYGLGGKKDGAAASVLHDKACTGGYAPACNSLGVLYKAGDGVSKDVARAFGYYRKSCDGAYTVGCFNLAGAYEQGAGIDVDLDKAEALYGQACEAGDKPACAAHRSIPNKRRFLSIPDASRVQKVSSVIDLYGVTFQYGVPPWLGEPKNFMKEVKTYKNQQGNNFIFELIPADETFEDWKTMFAVSAMRNNQNVHVELWQNYSLDTLRKVCRGYREDSFLSNEKASVVLAICPQVQGAPMKGYEGGMGEIGLFGFMVNDNVLINHHIEWKGKAFDPDNETTWPVTQSEIDKALSALKAARAIGTNGVLAFH